MDHNNDIIRSMRVLLVLCCAIALADNAASAVSSTVVVSIAVIMITLSGSALLFPGKKRDEVLNDR